LRWSSLIGKNITLVGHNGDGQTTKVANQIIVALTIEAVGEALLFASKAGADPARVRTALMGGFANSRISVSVRKFPVGLHSFRSLRRMETSRRKASAFRLWFFQSFASRRQRSSQAMVRSTNHRLGSTTNRPASDRLTISTSSWLMACSTASLSRIPDSRRRRIAYAGMETDQTASLRAAHHRRGLEDWRNA